MNFGSKGGMTVRISVTRNGETEVFLTGNSYKNWTDQATELIYGRYGDRMHGWRYSDIADLQITVEKSRSPWVGWGGLKWCAEEIMQEELNREGCQTGEPDNPNARQYSSFKFEPYEAGYRKLMRELM